MTDDARIPPLRFAPVYKDYLWGGGRIASRFHRGDAPAVCAESWEISAHPDGMGVVRDGPFRGRTLAELCEAFGRRLLGSRAPDAARFPLLVKLIDARESLSVQVHPSRADPAADPREIKNECWHCLDRTASARIYAGFRPAYAERAAFARAAANGLEAVGDTLRALVPEPGETLFVPAGLVHAIGAGCLIYEVQQSANTTYRLHDWGRAGPDGRPRALHVREAMRSIDWSLPPPAFEAPAAVEGSPLKRCLRTPYFTILQLGPDAGRTVLDTQGESFHALFAKDGPFSLSTAAGDLALPLGASALVPACAGAYALEPLAPGATALVTTL